jgi:hypothetical protein
MYKFWVLCIFFYTKKLNAIKKPDGSIFYMNDRGSKHKSAKVIVALVTHIRKEAYGLQAVATHKWRRISKSRMINLSRQGALSMMSSCN